MHGHNGVPLRHHVFVNKVGLRSYFGCDGRQRRAAVVAVKQDFLLGRTPRVASLFEADMDVRKNPKTLRFMDGLHRFW